MPSPSELTKMMVGVMDAVIYLNEHHLVHLAIMAANVLVAQDHVCKLTGFQFTREMTKQVFESLSRLLSVLNYLLKVGILNPSESCFWDYAG